MLALPRNTPLTSFMSTKLQGPGMPLIVLYSDFPSPPNMSFNVKNKHHHHFNTKICLQHISFSNMEIPFKHNYLEDF